MTPIQINVKEIWQKQTANGKPYIKILAKGTRLYYNYFGKQETPISSGSILLVESEPSDDGKYNNIKKILSVTQPATQQTQPSKTQEAQPYNIDAEFLASKAFIEANFGTADYSIGDIIAEHARQKFALYMSRIIQKNKQDNIRSIK